MIFCCVMTLKKKNANYCRSTSISLGYIHLQTGFEFRANVTLPTDSRKQGAYLRDLGKNVSRISDLKRGDLMFFMKYQGSEPEDYAGINKSKQRITHVGIYLGDGKILHTYSKDSGGVRINQVTDTAWEHRFLFGCGAL